MKHLKTVSQFINESTSEKELIAYHGTDSKFDKFELNGNIIKAPGNLRGFYFAKDKADAKEYGHIVIKVKLKYTKMFEGNPFDHYAKIKNLDQPSFGSKPEDIQEYNRLVNPDTVKEFLISNKYDIVFVPAKEHYINVDEYIVFDNNNIEVIE